MEHQLRVFFPVDTDQSSARLDVTGCLTDAGARALLRQNLSAIPTDELYLLIDQLFSELDSPAPSTATLMQYNDLTAELELRQSLNLPEVALSGEGR
ncbi:hypothetical protein [Arthrobacter roseus]|uniref:hypothetical protein n=1 Tax=Arthrobacter roseus TaxID=136274 RepID=UPI001962A412|nr:hypothetical protein [Arthrobacter roseus]MBM7847221.1 hypothetical protein [Arthrobacter roseus]